MAKAIKNSAGELFQPSYVFTDGKVHWVLDCSMRGGECVLLDGAGNPLPENAQPVYLPFHPAIDALGDRCCQELERIGERWER